jgi:hypothetical protein
MTIEVRDIDTLDADNVAQKLAFVSARIQEQNPRLDLRRGVLHDLLAYYNAILAEQLDANVQDYLAARSLLAIEEDPTLADPELVDHVLSNFGVTRKEGSKAAGEVAVVVSEDVTLTMSSGFQFQSSGKLFRTSRVYTAKKEAAQINDAGDRLLTELSDGNFRFTVFVTAVDEGPSSRLAKDTLVTPVVVPANYVTSYAVSTFSGGKSSESNRQLLARLQQGVACKAPSNRVNMAAMLRQIDAFSRVVGTSILGMGDPEMLRDKHTVFPVGLGGRVDWYVRTEERTTKKLLEKTATCIAKDVAENSSTWQLAVTREDAPGFYELRNIRRAESESVIGGFTVVSETRSLDLTGDTFIPDVADMLEGDYTRFVAAVVQFTDDASGQDQIEVGDTATYQLEAVYLPLIGDIQDTMSLPDVRSRPADVLVKAPVPCRLQLAFTVFKTSGQADPDLDAIKTDLASVVNQTGFVGKLFASTLQSAVSERLLEGQSVGAIDMLGKIRYPGGSLKHIRNSEVLSVPTEAAKLVTPRTVQFYLDPEDVGITMVTAVPSNL